MTDSPPPEDDFGDAPEKGRLDFITPRVTRRIERARDERGTRRVARLRRWLPLGAGAVLLLLFLWPKIEPGFVMKDVVKKIPDLVIDNLHYTGTDKKNRPFTLTAAQATRPGNLQDIYDLKKPEGEMTTQDGWLDARADFGRYDEKNRQLWLGGHVRIFHDKGYEFHTSEAEVNIADKDAWGDKPVLIQGNFGTIHGSGFRSLDSGNTVVIEGPATATLYLHRKAASDKGPSLPESNH